MSKTARPVALALILGAGIIGCTSGRPQWFSPGTSSYQQMRAQRFDPYPDNNAGPAIDDVRPRDFQTPPPEPARARWQRWGAGQGS